MVSSPTDEQLPDKPSQSAAVQTVDEATRTSASMSAFSDSPYITPDGELRASEVVFRLGLLLGAALFLIEGMGPPWHRNWAVLAAALFMAALIIITLSTQWRVLGDWRRGTQQLVVGALVVVLAIPLAALLSPQIAEAALPESLKVFLTEANAAIRKVPGFGAAVSIMHGVVVFFFYVVVMMVLVATSGPNQRAGFGVISLGMIVLALFLYPTPETVVGLLLLGFFIRVQWEKPLLLPDRLRPHLTQQQVDFLQELVEQGSLSTGETKLYLDYNATAFAELLDYRLAEYDNFSRQVVPGQRLLHDPAVETLEKMLGLGRRAVWFLVGLTYLITPDLIPGPVDDIIVMLLCSGAGMNWFSDLLGRGRRGGYPARRM